MNYDHKSDLWEFTWLHTAPCRLHVSGCWIGFQKETDSAHLVVDKVFEAYELPVMIETTR